MSGILFFIFASCHPLTPTLCQACQGDSAQNTFTKLYINLVCRFHGRFGLGTFLLYHCYIQYQTPVSSLHVSDLVISAQCSSALSMRLGDISKQIIIVITILDLIELYSPQCLRDSHLLLPPSSPRFSTPRGTHPFEVSDGSTYNRAL